MAPAPKVVTTKPDLTFQGKGRGGVMTTGKQAVERLVWIFAAGAVLGGCAHRGAGPSVGGRRIARRQQGGLRTGRWRVGLRQRRCLERHARRTGDGDDAHQGDGEQLRAAPDPPRLQGFPAGDRKRTGDESAASVFDQQRSSRAVDRHHRSGVRLHSFRARAVVPAVLPDPDDVGRAVGPGPEYL